MHSNLIVFFAKVISKVHGKKENNSMCGRYSLAVDTASIQLAFNLDLSTVDWQPTFSIAPSTPVPLIREREGQRGLSQGVWGFRPPWAKGDGPRPINARLETVATKAIFAQSFAYRRAIIPMTSYFEWVLETDPATGKGVKQPYAIALPDRGILAAAGLWTAFRASPNQPWALSCTILTTDGVDSAGEVHDRMPVFLTPDLWGWWLDPARHGNPEDLTLLEGASTDIGAHLEVWAVSRRVNATRTLDPYDETLLTPIQ